MNAIVIMAGSVTRLALALICILLGGFAETLKATPTINLPVNAVSVGQRAGSVTIPVEVTGAFNEDSWWGILYPEFTYATQAGTTSSGVGYEGTSGTRLEFSEEESTIFISIPIYYTGATSDRFFTVVISNPYYANLGATTAVTVTIKGEKPSPKLNIKTTKGPLKTKFTIYGNVANAKDSEIKSVSLTINGKRMILEGKQSWKAKGVRANVAGTYKMVAKAYLKNGTVLTKTANLYIY